MVQKTYVLIKIIILLNLLKCMEMKRQCINGMTTPGYTIPPDDIVVEHGSPLDITCILNEEYQQLHPNVTSESLYFERGGEVIPKELITIVNSSSIHLHIEQPEVSAWLYNCKLKNLGGVCLNTVYVGTQPTFVDDLNCTGLNYENLTCTWTTLYNPVPTTYSLRYLTGSPNNRHLSNDCPILQKLSNNRMSCTWTLTSQPPYRPAIEELHFDLSAVNQLGTAHLNKNISHFKHVIPGVPENLTCANSTSDLVVLKWSVPNAMQLFPSGLDHRVMYKSEFDSEWLLAGILFSNPHNKTKRMTYNLANLTHAFASYEVAIAMRSAIAEPDDQTMWSKYTNATFRTKAKLPGRPPATTIGSFEIIHTGNALQKLREVYVYWQHISDKNRNGKNFRYEVEEKSNSMLKPIEVTNAYAKFTNLSTDDSYVFKIWSANNIGRSANFTTVIVPQESNGVAGPAHFTKLIRDDHAYELSWDSVDYPVNNFTIFACMYDRDRPYQCAGNLYWKVIPPHKINYVVKPPEPKKIYQFAISANSDHYTSGMVWAECTVISNQASNKLKNVWINQMGATFVVINWKLDCSERIGGIGGFSVHYCNYSSFFRDKCEWSETNFDGLNIEQANITRLVPYTKYVFLLAKLTKSGEMLQKSDYLFGTTQEAAPTPPIDLKVVNTTNTSVTVSWNEPVTTNGKISHYVILRKNHIFKVNATMREFTMHNLTSYTSYNVSIFACTVACSLSSPTLLVKTQGGYPSRISQPGVTFQNDSITLVEWERPAHPNGDNDIYEIRFKERRRYENKTLSIMNTTDKWHMVEDCGSGGRYNTFFISVRAVNILNGTRYEGPWSDELQSFCRQVSSNAWIWGLAPLLLIIAFLVYIARRMYYNYQKMRDIEVKLPPGLEILSITPANVVHQLTVIEEVPLNEKVTLDTKKSGFAHENKQLYLPMGTPKTDNKIFSSPGYVLAESIFPSKPKEEYVTMSDSNTPVQTEEVRYVQVGDVLPPEKRNSIILVANNVTINTGYVTIGDILPSKKS